MNKVNRKTIAFLGKNYNKKISIDSYYFARDFYVENNDRGYIISHKNINTALSGILLYCENFQDEEILIITNTDKKIDKNVLNVSSNKIKCISYNELIDQYKKYIPFSKQFIELDFIDQGKKIRELQKQNIEWFDWNYDTICSNYSRNVESNEAKNIFNTKWYNVILMDGLIFHNNNNFKSNILFQSCCLIPSVYNWVLIEKFPQYDNQYKKSFLMWSALIRHEESPSVKKWNDYSFNKLSYLLENSLIEFKTNNSNEIVIVSGIRKNKRKRQSTNSSSSSFSHSSSSILFNNNNNNNNNNDNNNFITKMKKHYKLIIPDPKNERDIQTHTMDLYKSAIYAIQSDNQQFFFQTKEKYKKLINFKDNLKALSLSKYISIRHPNANIDNLSITEKSVSKILAQQIKKIIIIFSENSTKIFCEVMIKNMNIEDVECILLSNFNTNDYECDNNTYTRIIFYDPWQFNSREAKKKYEWILKKHNWSICWLIYDPSIEENVINQYINCDDTKKIYTRGKKYINNIATMCFVPHISSRKYYDEELCILLFSNNNGIINDSIYDMYNSSNNNNINNEINRQLGYVYTIQDINAIALINQRNQQLSTLSFNTNNYDIPSFNLPLGSQLFIFNINDYTYQFKNSPIIFLPQKYKITLNIQSSFIQLIKIINLARHTCTKLNQIDKIDQIDVKIGKLLKKLKETNFKLTEPLNILENDLKFIRDNANSFKNNKEYLKTINQTTKKINNYYSRPGIKQLKQKIRALKKQLNQRKNEKHKLMSANRSIDWIISKTKCSISFVIVSKNNSIMSPDDFGCISNYESNDCIITKTINIDSDLIVTLSSINSINISNHCYNSIFTVDRTKLLQLALNSTNNQISELALISYCIPHSKYNYIKATNDSIILIHRNILIGYAGASGFKLFSEYLKTKLAQHTMISFDLVPYYSAETLKDFCKNNTCELSIHTDIHEKLLAKYSKNWIRITITKIYNIKKKK